MKITSSLSFLFLASILSFVACKDSQESCNNIDYNQSFVAQEGDLFCLPDGNEILVEELVNAFCPCHAICVWEGEWQALLDLSIDNQNVSDYVFHGHPESTVNEDLPNDLEIIAHDFEYDGDCTQSNPSPPIKSVVLEIRIN